MGVCCIQSEETVKGTEWDSLASFDNLPKVKVVEDFNIPNPRSLEQIRRQITSTYEIRDSLPLEFERECTVLQNESERLSRATQASVDPEEFSFSQVINQISDPKIRRAVAKEFKREATPIVKKHGVFMCRSFSLYHRKRDELVGPYQVHIENYNPEWKTKAIEVVNLIKSLGCAKEWKVEHIGSTAVPNLCAKPIIDIMITIPSANGFTNAIDDFLREQRGLELDIRIGFKCKAPGSNEDWAFFQVPKKKNPVSGLNEVNIHLFADDSRNAWEKRVFRDYLSSPEGAALRDDYGKVKMDLMKKLSRNEFSVSEYAMKKNEIVTKILQEGFKWGGIDYRPLSTTSRSSVIFMRDSMLQNVKSVGSSPISLKSSSGSALELSVGLRAVAPQHSGDLHNRFSGVAMPKEVGKSTSNIEVLF